MAVQNNIVLHGPLALRAPGTPSGTLMDKQVDKQAPGAPIPPTARMRPYAPRTWFILVNHERALFYCRQRQALEFMGGATPQIPPRKPWVTDLSAVFQARSSRSGGAARSGRAAPGTEARQQEFAFLCSLADYLEEACAQNAFDELVLIAPPPTLGMLRGILPENMEDRVRLELSRDLLDMPTDRIRRLIEREAFH